MPDQTSDSCRSRWLAPILLLLILVIAAIFAVARSRRSSGGAAVSETRTMLTTYITLTVVAQDEQKAREHIAAGFDRIAELDRTLSFQKPDSELSRLNDRAGCGPVAVSNDLYTVVEAGVLWYGRTRGTFDIAVGPLMELWHACGKLNRLPTPEEIARVKPLLDAGGIILNPSARAVTLPVKGMRLDLGGLGKGYIADEVAKLLVGRGVKSALVAVSGEICAVGLSPSGRPWRIGIQDPRKPHSSQALVAVLELSGRSVSTSGNYERFEQIQGRRYSHIVDPRTGRTAEGVSSVTVIGPDTMTTDLLGAALSVLGVQEGMALIEKLPQVEAMCITLDERNEMHITRSKGFAAFEAKR